MSRWLNTILFLGAGWYVRYHNGLGGEVLVLPGTSSLVGRDPMARGEVSWQILIVLGGLFFLWECFKLARRGQHSSTDEG